MDLNYTIDTNTEQVVVKFEEDILGAADNLEDLMSELDKTILAGTKICNVDLAGVKYMNSTGLGVLIRILTKFRNAGGDTYLSKVSEPVQKLLLITKLNSIFEMK